MAHVPSMGVVDRLGRREHVPGGRRQPRHGQRSGLADAFEERLETELDCAGVELKGGSGQTGLDLHKKPLHVRLARHAHLSLLCVLALRIS
ncbi:MAG: hypothetical protein LC797_19355 [Chloroflexi bacterium]|nr:hypothetical protein [Chloroflexota bacterium]